jgi:hypothetical protein
MRILLTFGVLAACGGGGNAIPDAAIDAAPPPVLSALSFRTADNPGLLHDVIATIDDIGVRATLPFRGDPHALVATFASTGDVTVADVAQASGATAHDFSSPVTYRVSVPGGSTRDYAVNVAVPDFAAAVQETTTTLGSISTIAIGDLDGDGRPDLAVTRNTDNEIAILVNTTAPGSATPSFAPTEIDVPSIGSVALVLADLDGDGRLDLAAPESNGAVAIMINTTIAAGTPSFAGKVEVPVCGGFSLSIVAGDLNGDAKPDLVVACGDGVGVLVNTTTTAGTPTFTALAFSSGPGAGGVALGDLDGDGRLDVGVATNGLCCISNSVAVLRNTTPAGGMVQLDDQGELMTDGGMVRAITIADLDGDGRLDLATANHQGATASVFVNHLVSPATFDRFDFPAEVLADALATLDLDHDQRPDVVVANQSTNTISILTNTTIAGGAPRLAPQVELPAGAGPISVAVGDLNADGKPDLVVADSSSAIDVLLAR